MNGQQIGYIRVSSISQNTERQLHGIELDKVFEEKCSGKDTNRPKLAECLAYLRSGDTLHIHSIDRLARSLRDLLAIVEELLGRGVKIVFHKEQMELGGSNPNPSQTLYLNLLGAFAEFERNLLKERIFEGIKLARERNGYKNCGRKRLLSETQIDQIKQKLTEGVSISSISRDLHISRNTIYRYCK